SRLSHARRDGAFDGGLHFFGSFSNGVPEGLRPYYASNDRRPIEHKTEFGGRFGSGERARIGRQCVDFGFATDGFVSFADSVDSVVLVRAPQQSPPRAYLGLRTAWFDTGYGVYRHRFFQAHSNDLQSLVSSAPRSATRIRLLSLLRHDASF